ncbi:MAG: G8 domain-containing protein [Planctomycetia bacterium]|nr:G8 domain-containing protein [Planctomycetia bacterium]
MRKVARHRFESLESRRLMSVAPHMVANFVPGLYSFEPEDFTAAELGVFFTADHGDFGRELWITRGDAGSTRLVTDIVPGEVAADPDLLTAVGAKVYFVASTPGAGRELWTSDGSAAGTRMVADVNPGKASSSPHSLTRVGNDLYFVVTSDEVDELWTTDGTAAGTVLLRSFSRSHDGAGLAELTALGDHLVFSAPDSLFGRELWRSDGTIAGTKLLADVQIGVASSDPSRLSAVGSVLYFAANDGVHGAEPWRTDGELNTVMVGDLQVGAEGSSPREFVRTMNEVFFTANDGRHGRELWKIDPTTGVASLVSDMIPGPTGQADVIELTASEREVYFASSSDDGLELWASDGTTAGTREIVDARPGALSSSPQDLRIAGEHLFFTAEQESTGRELWMLDLADQSALLSTDIYPGFRGSHVTDPVSWHGAILFGANDGHYGQEVWIAGDPLAAERDPLVMLNLTHSYFGSAVPAGKFGDWDGNGVVSITDLNLVRGLFGPSGSDTHAHPELDHEHDAVMHLVDVHEATHFAVQNGDWSDPATWGGDVPNEGARVVIGEELTVTIDGYINAAMRTIRVDGTLRFATDVTTRLRVDTLVVTPKGYLEIGTAEHPVAEGVVATMELGDTAPIDREMDPQALGGGLISHGRVSIQGQSKSSYVALAGPARSGDEWLELTATPDGWRLGDRVVLPEAMGLGSRDEEFQILEIDGQRVRVAPLTYDHLTPRDDLSIHLANLTRNVVFVSVTPGDWTRQGHVMFMHSPTVSVAFAAFDHLGRTNKAIPLDDSVLDAFGRLISGTGSNPRARYAVHFHRMGVAPDRGTAKIVGSAVITSPGWGIVNHSSRVDVEDNVVFHVTGASFATEVGSEVGTFRRNLALRSSGSGVRIDDRVANQDFGHEGVGFWFQGGGVDVSDNIAVGHANAGYFFGTVGLLERGLGTGAFLTANLRDASWARKDTVDVRFVPLFNFANNVVYASTLGLQFWRHMEKRVPHNHFSVVDGFTGWELSLLGIEFDYTKQVELRNVRLFGNLSDSEPVHFGKAITANKDSGSIAVINPTIEGWSVGIKVAPRGNNRVEGGYLNNLSNVRVMKAWEPNRSLNVEGVQFGNLNVIRTRGARQFDLIADSDQTPYIMVRQQVYIFDTQTYFSPHVVTLDGQQVFLDRQLPDAVAFDGYAQGTYIPAAVVGLTNEQLWDDFGVAVSGAPPAGDLTKDRRILGSIGPVVEQLPAINVLSEQYTEQLRGYQLSYRVGDETIVESTPVDLVRGWNLLAREIGGRTRSLFVYAIGDPGDTNGDRIIDATDIDIVYENLGRYGAQIPGDVDDDGAVTAADLDLVIANLPVGFELPAPRSVESAATRALRATLSDAMFKLLAEPSAHAQATFGRRPTRRPS